MTKQRKLLVLTGYNQKRSCGETPLIDATKSIHELLEPLLIQIGSPLEISSNIVDYVIRDWELNPVELNTPVSMIPNPGVLLLVQASSDPLEVFVTALKMGAEDEGKVARWLASPNANFEAITPKTVGKRILHAIIAKPSIFGFGIDIRSLFKRSKQS